MKSLLCFFLLWLPIAGFAQYTVSGRLLNLADSRPIANASIFINNTTIGSKTGEHGTFTLKNISTGKYELIITTVGFEKFSQSITISNANIQLGDIKLAPQNVVLKEVTIKYRADPNREKYMGWFKDEFLGTSERAKACKIVNPQLLDFDYDDIHHKLTASSGDYLIIENHALGYRLRYLVTDFSFENISETQKKIFYKGPVQFEELPGTASRKEKWIRNRQELYQNSPMHFLRSALNNTLTEEGFRVQKQIAVTNFDRPADSVISAKIRYYKRSHDSFANDSLSLWTRLSKLSKTFSKTITLSEKDFIKKSDNPGMYLLIGDTDKLFVAYNKTHRYHIKNSTEYLYNANNDELTLILFNSPTASFYSNGVITNPYNVAYYGVWGRNRVAELLPIDYEPLRDITPMAENAVMKKIVSKTDTFNAHYIKERVYLHFDKPYYAVGDTIYFKSYVTMGERHQLSDISGVLHVDLINPSNQILRSIKLRLNNGTAIGDFTLDNSLPAGGYAFRAYTRWMRNEGDSAYFSKAITVGSAVKNELKANSPRAVKAINNLKPDIQFFPEGGNLVVGIKSKVAFKTIGSDGLGIAFSGVLTDNNDLTVCSFTPSHLGMGYFYLSPEPGKTYKAKITYPDGSQTIVALLLPEPNGIVLAVNNDNEQKIQLKVSANQAYYKENKNKGFFILINSGGAVSTLPCKLDSSTLNLEIPRKNLFTGVAAATLFSATGEPLNERLFFVQNHDQLRLNLTGNTRYSREGKVSLTLHTVAVTGDASPGSFSVSVINESKVPFEQDNESTILTDLLLTGEVKGYIEKPNYYFADTVNHMPQLDMLMLTQGYRRFEWKRVLADNSPVVAYQAEKLLEINGTLSSFSGKPLNKGTVSLIPAAGGPVLNSVSDEKGLYHFGNLAFADSTRFVLSAVKENGQNSTTISYFPDTVPPVGSINYNQYHTSIDTVASVYLQNDQKYLRELMRQKGNSIILKEVQIKEKKAPPQYRTQSLAGAGNADQVLRSKDILGGQLSTSLYFLKGVTIVRNGNAATPYLTTELGTAGMHQPAPMRIIVDGTMLSSSPNNPVDVNLVNSTDVETIEVLKSANASIYGMDGGGGVLIITTKQGGAKSVKDVQSKGVLPITPVGFYRAKSFYSPKYKNVSQSAQTKDFRSTIYWNPELITDKTGDLSFEYFNADEPGTYKVIIEGIDEYGNLGRKVYRYKVE